MSITRRSFIGFTVGGAAGAAVGISAAGAGSRYLDALDRPVYPPRGPESFSLSLCDLCPGGCGVRVRRIAGRPVKIDGNPLHPVSGGRLCPKGQVALEALLHPDRIRTPLRRFGPRGDRASFKPATWDEAMSEIGDRLRLLRRQGRPESLALVRAGDDSLDERLATRFLRAFGSPNDVTLHRGNQTAAMAAELSQGIRRMPAYDVPKAEYLLSLGSAVLEAWTSPVHMMRGYGAFRQGRAGRRGKMVHAEARRSTTAMGADEWIRIQPGTEGIFALGVASVLVGEDLYDKEFVAQRATGFADSVNGDGTRQDGLRTILARDFSLERVSADTGLSVNSILRTAREFAAARPGLAIGSRKGPLLPGPLLDHLAAGTLNALVGNVDAPGGQLIPEEVPLRAWPELAEDPVARVGLETKRLDGADSGEYPLLASDPESLAEAMLAGSPYPAEIFLVLRADPLLTSAAPERFAMAMEKVSLAVTWSDIPNDTALHSDWILPEAHALERWGLATSPAGMPYPLVSLSAPVLGAEAGGVRAAGDVLLELGRRVGDPVAGALPWTDLAELIRDEVRGLYTARRGAIMGTPFDEAWVQLMERAGWWAPGYRNEQELWDRMKANGGWWDPFYDHRNWPRVLKTASGRFDFRPDLLQSLAARLRVKLSGRAGEGLRRPPRDRSLALLLFEPLPVAGGRGAEFPFLQEILDPSGEQRWDTWVEVHPETAAELGISQRQRVRIESPHGSIEARASVDSRVLPGVAAVPAGLGKSGGGRWAEGRGANPLALLAPVRDPVSGLPDFEGTRVFLTPLDDSPAAEPAGRS